MARDDDDAIAVSSDTASSSGAGNNIISQDALDEDGDSTSRLSQMRFVLTAFCLVWFDFV